eukprot:4158412-Pleurochrysis_carterae.AAC.1
MFVLAAASLTRLGREETTGKVDSEYSGRGSPYISIAGGHIPFALACLNTEQDTQHALLGGLPELLSAYSGWSWSILQAQHFPHNDRLRGEGLCCERRSTHGATINPFPSFAIGKERLCKRGQFSVTDASVLMRLSENRLFGARVACV